MFITRVFHAHVTTDLGHALLTWVTAPLNASTKVGLVFDLVENTPIQYIIYRQPGLVNFGLAFSKYDVTCAMKATGRISFRM